MSNTQKPNVVYWIIAVIALIWNVMGVNQYLQQAYRTDAFMAELNAAQIEFLNNSPSWVTAAFAIAVFAGVLGCIGLLLRKKWANLVFLLSLLAVIAQQIYHFFIQDFVKVEGASMYISISILLFAAFLYFYSKGLKNKGVLS